jgi:hypothetical protein
MKRYSLVLLIVLIAATVRAQESFTVAGIRPFNKAVPGQIMEVLIEGLASGGLPTMLPASDFKVEVAQDGVSQRANVRITKFTVIQQRSADSSGGDSAILKMIPYHLVSFVIPKGLHPGPSEVIVTYKGQRGNAVALEIVEQPLRPIVGTMSVISVGVAALPKPEGNDLGWRLERGATTRLSVQPLVDPDDPNAGVLIRFKQGANVYDAGTRISSTPSGVESSGRGVGLRGGREDLEVEVPAALAIGKVDVEIRLKANGQLSDPVTMTAMITDMARAGESANVSAPQVLAVTPKRVGAGQSLIISIDRRRTLEPSPKDTRVIIEQNNGRYFATIERNTALVGPSKEPDAPVALFVRTTRELIGRVQLRVLNSLRDEQTGLSAPVPLEIVDEVMPPEVISVNEATDADLSRLREIYEAQKQAGKPFPLYDPSRRYLTVRVRGVDYNAKFVRITLEQGAQKFTLTQADISLYSGDALILRLPKELTGGDLTLTMENSGGDRYSTPATKTFTLPLRR